MKFANWADRTTSLFTTDPLLEVARIQPFWIACMLSTIVYGFISTTFRTIKWPLLAGFILFTAGLVGFATVQPGDSTNTIVFSGLTGLGFGGPLVLIISAVQLATPHNLIATATAVTTSARAVAATTFTTIFAAALRDRLAILIPSYIATAAATAGLPATSIAAFVAALATGNTTTLVQVPGVNPEIIEAGVGALTQALADGLRVVYMIAAPFGALACIGCCFLGDMKDTMNYHVNAPVEDLHAKDKAHHV